jgi:hypothetical protein
MSLDRAHTVGELTGGYDSDEGYGSEYDLAQEFLFDDGDLGTYIRNHEDAKTARQLLGRVSAVLDLIRDARIGDLTWKDIPWADPKKAPLPVNEGVKAVIPELDAMGEKTGKFMVLEHDEYMRIMGSLAYVNEMSDGDPSRYTRRKTREEILERSSTFLPKAELPPGGMKK